MTARPIRVLNLVTKMDFLGGLENRLYQNYIAMDRDKVQFDFYTFRKHPGAFDEDLLSMGSRVFYNKGISVANVYTAVNNFKSFLHDHQYKIVHCHMNQWCGFLLKGAKEAGVPIRIAHSRNAFKALNTKNVIKNIVKLNVNRYATHRFAVSRKAGIWLFGQKADKNGLVHVWPNAIDSARYRYNSDVRAEIRQALNLGDNYTIMHVGTHKRQKNHKFLLAVFAAIKRNDPTARLVLVGGGKWDGVENQIKRIGLEDSVTLTGPRRDVHCLLQAADVFVFPSFYEGLPGAVLEAQAAGLPCIISDSITDEVCITPLVEQIPLSYTAEQWAEKVLNCKNEIREDTSNYFLSTGFDINGLADRLTEFYLKVSEDKWEKRDCSLWSPT